MADESRQLSQHSTGHRLSVSTFFSLSKERPCFVSGLRAVTDAEVIAAHKGTKLSVDEVGYLGMTTNMFQYVDIFSIPEVTLLRDVTQVRESSGKAARFSMNDVSSTSLIAVFRSLQNTFTTMFGYVSILVRQPTSNLMLNTFRKRWAPSIRVA